MGLSFVIRLWQYVLGYYPCLVIVLSKDKERCVVRYVLFSAILYLVVGSVGILFLVDGLAAAGVNKEARETIALGVSIVLVSLLLLAPITVGVRAMLCTKPGKEEGNEQHHKDLDSGFVHQCIR